MLIFVKNREKIFLFYPLRQRRSAVRNGGRRKCLDARKASGKGTMNPENSIFLPSAGGCNAASAIGILTKGRLRRIRHFPDSMV
jgi:hypothetical protein